MSFKSLLSAIAISTMVLVPSALAQSPADLDDLEIAHVAYTADNIDIRYAHLALAISSNADVRKFAGTMIRDHETVNELALALLAKLNAKPKDNFLSKSLLKNADKLVHEMSHLHGAAFDKRYAENELGYHKAVIDLVKNSFIPNIENGEVRDLFKAGLEIFQAHQVQAEKLVKAVKY